MKRYEKALEELKIKYEAQNAAIDELKLKARILLRHVKKLLQAQETSLKRQLNVLLLLLMEKTYQEYLESLNDESNS